MTGYINISQMKAAVLDKTIEILIFKCYLQQTTCLENMTGYINISQNESSDIRQNDRNFNIQKFLQQSNCLENMTGYIIISQKKTFVSDTTIEILHSNIINNNKNLLLLQFVILTFLKQIFHKNYYTFLLVNLSLLRFHTRLLKVNFLEFNLKYLKL